MSQGMTSLSDLLWFSGGPRIF